jgi:regulatory protein
MSGMPDNKKQENRFLIPEEYQKARAKAMRLLENMPRTERQLFDKLKAAQFSEEAIADAMAYVKSFGYVNDLRYAEQYLLSRMKSKSRQQLFIALAGKGIDRHTAQIAWDEVTELEEPDERAMIREGILKKAEPGSEIDEKELRRLYGYFGRRGFRTSDVTSVLNELDISIHRDTF